SVVRAGTDPVPETGRGTTEERMDESLLSIGELAAHSGLSPEALRLYDESGLLVPRRVDPSTGYRSYGTDQVGRARLIAALRGLGMGLARIRVLRSEERRVGKECRGRGLPDR